MWDLSYFIAPHILMETDLIVSKWLISLKKMLFSVPWVYVLLEIVLGNVKSRWLPSAGPVDNRHIQRAPKPSTGTFYIYVNL